MLYAREIPKVGGDTLYANMHLVWENLPSALQNIVADKQAIHSYTAPIVGLVTANSGALH